MAGAGHFRQHGRLELLSSRGLALLERGVHLRVDTAEDLRHVGLGGGVDLLDLGCDLCSLGLVCALGALLVASQPRESGALRALQIGDPGVGDRGGLPSALLDHLLLLPAVLLGSGVGMLRCSLLGLECLLELRLVGVGELLLGDPCTRHLLVGLVLACLQVHLLGRGWLGRRVIGSDHCGGAGLLRGQRRHGLGYRRGRVGRCLGGPLDVLGLVFLAACH